MSRRILHSLHMTDVIHAWRDCSGFNETRKTCFDRGCCLFHRINLGSSMTEQNRSGAAIAAASTANSAYLLMLNEEARLPTDREANL